MVTTIASQPETALQQNLARPERQAATALMPPGSPAAAPLSIGRLALTVRDLPVMTAFYHDIIGLEPIKSGKDLAVLGAGGRPLLELLANPAARPDDPREAGLFHMAFLLPGRTDLGRWHAHANAAQCRLGGASDHLVSEAFYLSDPEGNGIEVYADRDPATWAWRDGQVVMDTLRLDVRGLAAGIDHAHPGWTGMPGGTVIGHVHLRVGDIAGAERFYVEELGFERTSAMPGASFVSTGHYHHHVGMNVWRSAGSGKRAGDRTGLAWFEVLDRRPGAMTALYTDPWGTGVRVTPLA